MAHEPLYMDIYSDIAEKIRSGVWAENVPLPAERTLCQMYHVSRTTVRRALEHLVRDGFIFKKHGNGNFVKPHVYEQPLSKFYSFTDSLKKAGLLIGNRIVDYELVQADIDLARTMQCEAGERIHKLTRLRLLDDHPLMLETSYLPKNRFFHLDIDWLQNHSLYDYLITQYSMRVDYSDEVFFPVLPTPEQRTLLNIPASLPCMAVERLNSEGGKIIIHTHAVVRGDKYKFRAELTIV